MVALLLLLTLGATVSAAEDTAVLNQTADRIAALLDVIDAEHIAPPPRSELLEAAIDELAEKVDDDLAAWKERIPAELDRATTVALVRSLLNAETDAELRTIANTMIAGIGQRLPGALSTVDPETARVDAQVEGNRYEGVGVILDLSGERPKVRGTYHGGPAHRAGLAEGDVIYEVAGFDTQGMTPNEFLEYSRDELGTELEYVVGQPDDERRTVRLTREVVPRETVLGNVRGADERWRHRIGESEVAYVQLSGLAASTPHELRKVGAQLRREGLDRLVLDLRGLFSINIHAAVLVADQFVTDGTLGASETRHRRRVYSAGPDALFEPQTTVVLVDERTAAAATWLAAVLRHRGARIAGTATAEWPYLRSVLEVPDWPAPVRIATGWLLDPGDGEVLAAVEPDLLVEDDEDVVGRARALLDAAP